MIETNSKTQKNSIAILLQEPPRFLVGLRMIGVCLLGLAFAWSVALSATAQAKPATDTKTAKTQNAGDFVGSEACATCHTDEAKNFDGNPHAKLALEHGKSGATCEGCHGAGREHVESGGDKTKIFSFKTASPKEASARCLSCHEGTHPNFLRSQHAKAAVGCTSCHSVHAPSEELDAKDHLLAMAEPKLCFGCHSDVKPSFSMPFHHKVNEGAVTCSDCHDVHGTFGNNNLKSTADQNAICTKCHTETRGPFVYEHAAVKAEGCMGCHTPHGSQNARLLNMPNVNTLCNQCHSPVAAGTIHSMSAGSSELTPCTSCHTYIHGSNVNPAFLR
jgi:DmsE family decaheme c-type cytochrome